MAMRKSLINKLLIALVATIVIVYFYPHPESNRYNYEEGRPWSYSKLIAPFDIPIHPDSATMQAARDSLDAHFVPIYQLNQLMIDTIVSKLPQAKDNRLRNRLAQELRQVYADGVVDMRTMESVNRGLLPKVRILEKNILSEAPTASFFSPREAYQYLDSTITDPELRSYFLSANLQNILQPNYIRNDEECRRHYEYSFLTITADRGIILQGQTIIDKGAIVSSQDYTNIRTYEEMLAQLNSKGNQSEWLMLLGQFLYVAILMSMLMMYLYFYAPDIFRTVRGVSFICSVVTVFFLVGVGLNYFVAQGIYIAPMMIVPTLVLVFFDGRTAMFVSSVLTLICAGITAFALEFLFLQFCATGAVIFSLRELSRRAQLLRTSLFIALTYLVGYLALELLMNGSFDGLTWRMTAILMVNAALTSMAYILMSLVERVFGFISVVTLVELADINNPLLLRLSNECPGTFQHSVAVSNLASDAAQRINANVQLVRAGTLYHDIGKLGNPAFFTENQHGVNPHDALSPELSASIVTRHVTDGIALANKAKLPEVIKQFIREHHGRGMAKYFYITACKNSPEGKVDGAPYSYPGPNPQSRETSVLMMADAVEAASRSMPLHTREAITELVNKIVDGQIAEGLHNESTLSFRDVAKIKEAFIKRLMTIYHSRIAYPTAPKNKPTETSNADSTDSK